LKAYGVVEIRLHTFLMWTQGARKSVILFLEHGPGIHSAGRVVVPQSWSCHIEKGRNSWPCRKSNYDPSVAYCTV